MSKYIIKRLLICVMILFFVPWATIFASKNFNDFNKVVYVVILFKLKIGQEIHRLEQIPMYILPYIFAFFNRNFQIY